MQVAAAALGPGSPLRYGRDDSFRQTMALLLHDTLQRKKVPFTPRDPSRVTLYVCGPTVYSYAHIGNARPVVVFDMLFRLLRRLYGEEAVLYARNVTDVDDKINAAAVREGVEISVITERFLGIYEADMAALGALAPTHQPRATAHIPAMLEQIGRLVEAGAAYAAQGHVLFRIAAFARYGELSGRSLDDMIAGARVEVAPYKEHPADFVLWKPSKPGEPEWPSPWGPGRPGWHIECSAMSEEVLGLPIDIHGGGHDLIFPHHTNEIAQGCAAHGHADPSAYARHWMHNGFLTLDAEKMSKSAGATLRVHDLLESAPGEALRWALLSAHYRAPLEWTAELVAQSRRDLDKLYGVLQDARRAGLDDEADAPRAETLARPVREALLDDLNTPAAKSALFALAGELRAAISADDLRARTALASALVRAGEMLGILQADPEAWFAGDADDAFKSKAEALIAARAEARRAKDWPAADRIRDELAALRVEVLDGPGGVVSWRLKD